MNISTILIATSKHLNDLELSRIKRIIETAVSLNVKFIIFESPALINYLESIEADYTVYSLTNKSGVRYFNNVVDMVSFAIYNSDDIVYVGESTLVNLVRSLKTQKLSY